MGLLRLFSVALFASVWCFATSNATQEHTTSAPSPSPENSVDVASLQQRAQQGDARAAYLLGQFFMTGSGVPRDYQQAAKWFGEAAKQNQLDAQFWLGFLYENGFGVARDYKTAFSNYSAAAMQGQAAAQNNLATMYQRGRGTKKNLHAAERWYRASAVQSFTTAQCNLASFEYGRKDYRQAVFWFREAAKRGSAIAQESLAWMFYTGIGVPLDYSEAAKWMQLAAEQGVARAQLDLGFLYEQGKGVPLDYVSAFAWYKAAEEGGQKRASVQLESLFRFMTPHQRSAAMERAASVPRSTSGMDETEASIGTPLDDPAMNHAGVETHPSSRPDNKKRP